MLYLTVSLLIISINFSIMLSTVNTMLNIVAL